VSKGVMAGKKQLNVDNFRGFSKQKKFFLVSAAILLLAFFINLGVAAHYRKIKQSQSVVTNQLQNALDLLNKAEASLLYKDEGAAANYLSQAESAMPKQDAVPDASKSDFEQAQTQLKALQQKMEKITEVSVADLGNLSDGNLLIKLPPYLATAFNKTIISYNTNSGAIEDGSLLSSENILESVYIKNTTSVIYNGTSLLVWDYSKKQFSPPFSASVPGQDSYAGLKYYPTNSRVYMINKKTNQILNFAVGASISRPVVSVQGNDLSNAQDFAIDSSIYVLNSNGITKYLAGKLADFHMPYLVTAFSGQGRIFTDQATKNIYVLDKGNNRILVIDKKGALLSTLKNSKFTNLKDFSVDEKNKTIYVLNDGSLLKVNLP